jgi:proteasome lid subunit RPN8/RPN11
MACIELNEEILDAMRSHAIRDYPHECCGAIFGIDNGEERRVMEIMPIDNVSNEDRRRRFSVSPRDYLRAERAALGRGLLLLGFYHSHPDHPARPSATDRTFAQFGFSYPILSVAADGIRDITSWRLADPNGWYEAERIRRNDEV